MLNIQLQINRREALDVIDYLDNFNREHIQSMIDKYNIQDVRVNDIMSISKEVIQHLKNNKFNFAADARIEELYLWLNPQCDEDIDLLLTNYDEEEQYAIELSIECFLDDLEESINEYWDRVQED